MLDHTTDATLRISDLKQWTYCPRVYYYHQCLPDIRPETDSMRAGIDAGRAEENREERRSLRPYGLQDGERRFNVALRSDTLGLRGELDMLIVTSDEAIPVDYKLSDKTGVHFKLQLAAYGLLVEAALGLPVRRGFLYLIPSRKAQSVRFDARTRRLVELALAGMRQVNLRETMPPPSAQLARCVSCEFRRFCNDVL
jgi:CRISPR-associated exonuclease Cas4